MSISSPDWQRVAAQLIQYNNKLRSTLGMELRSPDALSWQKLADEVRAENVKLSERIKNPQPVMKLKPKVKPESKVEVKTNEGITSKQSDAQESNISRRKSSN